METRTLKTSAATIDESAFPKDGSLHDQLQFILNYAILASSFYDSQPWQFAIDDAAKAINVYADPTRWLRVADPDKRKLYLSLGCALENLLIAIDYYGLGHRSVAYFPERGNNEWATRIAIGTTDESVAPRPQRLLSAIDHGHSFPSGFKTQPLSKKDLGETIEFIRRMPYDDTSMAHRVSLDVFEDKDINRQLIRFVADSDILIFSQEGFRSELGQLLTKCPPSDPILSEQLEQLSSDPQVGKKIAKKESAKIANAPVFGILSTNFDDPTAAVQAGQAYERIMLEADLHGVSVYPTFQLTEITEMRMSLKTMFPDLKGFPQLVFAMGYPAQEVQQQARPRIPLNQVLRHM